MSVFRASTSPGADGLYSRDDYARSATGRLTQQGKADHKFHRPGIPDGAMLTKLDGQDVYTLCEMTPDEIEALRADLPELLRG